MIAHICNALSIIKEHRRAFIVLNIAFYGLFAISMTVTLFVPELHETAKLAMFEVLSQPGYMKAGADAYAGGHLLLAIGLTFVTNLGVSVVLTTLPSFVVPFSGILATLHRGALWGVLFAPIGPFRGTLIPHSLTLLLEGQAYVLAAFAAYVQGQLILRPRHYGIGSRWEGYRAGAVTVARIYVLIVLVLIVAAVYEGYDVIYLAPYFR
ncbi:hypothetical protein K32_16030 [Kaistia sp. 32K]|uniref:stage II sporulation protein M n=1 Tax=Kaistia sp. 32K TaxID=2795690 RepID=UPI00191632A7|nr:stage II sporulation protein M [Kaistia sp. 32K]BCP52986.1 hypothetical protein K32_16030 [Kaistia sp. 32K]